MFTAENLPLIISCSALALSVISPVVSSLISGHYRVKEKKLDMAFRLRERNQDFYTQHRVEVIERYLTAGWRVSRLATRETLSEFGAAMGEIYIYVDESLWPILDRIADSVGSATISQSIDSDLRELSKALAHQQIRTAVQEE